MTTMNDLLRKATAGTMESSDVYVEITPQSNGLVVELESVVKAQFGASILHTVEDVLRECGVENALVRIADRGALDCVIRARVETALRRAL